MALLNRMRADLADLIVVEQFPKLEGRQMIMMIAPGKKKSGALRQACGRGGSQSPAVGCRQQCRRSFRLTGLVAGELHKWRVEGLATQVGA